MDDGSCDGSAALVRAYAVADPRIRLVEPGRVGLVAALNRGIAEARAPLVARMDADDVMHPDRLRLQRHFLAANPSVALVACRVELFPEERIQAGWREYVRWQNACLTPDDIADGLSVESPLAHPSVTVRRDALLAVGGYADGPFPEDYELWLRMHRAGLRMAKLPDVLLRWREHDRRASRTDARYSREAFDALRAAFVASDPRLAAGRPAVVWGAGRRSRLRARGVMERGIDPAAWIDIDPKKVGQRVWDRPVHPPEWLAGRDPRPFVLVYVTSHGARELIAARLGEMGYVPREDWLAVG